uniref:Syntaxin 6/10/61 N-terminal domain-containing protein n=1 Tax=Solanum lycopersicum TaxID=4081 RepID=A0A3Q7JCL7_SOLLC
MGSYFDRWEKDPFFSAAEEVQESADRMESTYRTWIHALKDTSGRWNSDELCRDLRTTLGTAKWQLEEFDRAVSSSYSNTSTDDAKERHGEFVIAMDNQIKKVEKSLNESAFSQGNQWVRLDERELDELAVFLSGPSTSSSFSDKSSVKVDEVEQKPALWEEDCKQRMPEYSKSSSNLVDGSQVDTKDEMYSGHRKTASACGDISAWKIAVADDICGKQPVPPPRKIPSIQGLLNCVESATKLKWSKNGYRKLRFNSDDHQEADCTLPQSLPLTRGINTCCERSKSCLDCCDERYQKQLNGCFIGVPYLSDEPIFLQTKKKACWVRKINKQLPIIYTLYRQAVKVLAKSPTFAKDPRSLQFEADVNRLFLYTSYNRLGKDAVETDAEEIIDMAGKASLADQQKQVQENVHSQITSFCKYMDHILQPDLTVKDKPETPSSENNSSPRRSGLSFAIGRTAPLKDHSAIPESKPLKRTEVSQSLKDLMGYTLEVKPSQIPHEDAGQGLFIRGEADVGTVLAVYPGVIYSPAYYRYIPGYPRVDAQNSYLITRYDGTVINAQPWGAGGESREIWDGSSLPEPKHIMQADGKGSERIWKMLSKPLDGTRLGGNHEVLERRNPLAFAHFANHPARDMVPNVMVCPYDFPLPEKHMRAYIPNISFGNGEEANMRRFGTFWFKSWKSGKNGLDVPVLKTLVLVATRAISNEEILLNYRLSNSKLRPSWYTPVDEEEDRRRWS